LVCGWQKDRGGGFTSRHPELVTSNGTLQLRDGGAPRISDEDFLGLARRQGTDPNPAGVPAKGAPAGSPAESVGSRHAIQLPQRRSFAPSRGQRPNNRSGHR
jgi:hypothetical protein